MSSQLFVLHIYISQPTTRLSSSANASLLYCMSSVLFLGGWVFIFYAVFFLALKLQ